jgi:multicomponent K+:H+ antiporter subunit E
MGLPFPLLLWLALVAMWLLLNGTLALADLFLGSLAALAAVLGLRLLQPPSTRLRRPWIAATLAAVVLLDIVRSNVAVATIVLRRGTHGRTEGFVDIPLEMRHPTALAVLACIITSTPGTAWAGYDSRSGVLTIHVLDLVDRAAWVRTIKARYERRLMEIFE